MQTMMRSQVNARRRNATTSSTHCTATATAVGIGANPMRAGPRVARPETAVMTTRSTAVLTAVRERVRKYISVPASDAEALKICFLCATVESEALLELSHSRVVRNEARTHRKVLAITPDEFDALLEEDACNQSRKFNLTTALLEDERDAERQNQREAIESALKLTLAEPAQSELWTSNPRVRMRVSLATLRREGHTACMKQALGEVLQSDLRRIDDLRADTEANGIDIMSVAALISTVCTHIAG